MGDNLADFSAAFDIKDEAGRLSATMGNAAQFGRKFIVLPNPVYGDWEAAILSGNYNRTDAQRDSIYLNKSKGY
jgi:predicted secreted acid phosphatase